MIYFVQAVEGGPIKIGTSIDVPRRIAQLETYYKQPLVLLRVMEGGETEESAIHARFDHLRLEGTGKGRQVEQFRPADDLMEFIGRVELVSPNAATVEAMPSLVAMTIRAPQEWLDWLDGLRALHDNVPRTTLVDISLRRLAKQSKYPEPPARY